MKGIYNIETQVTPKLEAHFLHSQGLDALLSDYLPSSRGTRLSCLPGIFPMPWDPWQSWSPTLTPPSGSNPAPLPTPQTQLLEAFTESLSLVPEAPEAKSSRCHPRAPMRSISLKMNQDTCVRPGMLRTLWPLAIGIWTGTPMEASPTGGPVSTCPIPVTSSSSFCYEGPSLPATSSQGPRGPGTGSGPQVTSLPPISSQTLSSVHKCTW